MKRCYFSLFHCFWRFYLSVLLVNKLAGVFRVISYTQFLTFGLGFDKVSFSNIREKEY